MALSPQENGNGDVASVPSGLVVLKDQFLIDPSDPLPDLDTPSATAFSAKSRRNQDIHLFALIGTPGLPLRLEAIRHLRGEAIPGIMPMVDWDTVFWPPMNQETVVIIYQRPLGGSVVRAIESGEYKVNEYELQGTTIGPIYRGIKEISARGVQHRQIRIGNLYFMDKAREEMVLGDCALSPPGFDQPLIYEPIERGMASPAGRGTGLLGDDLYALGVSLVLLLLGEKNVKGKDSEDILYSKIENGTYSTLCGKTRIPVNMLEPLRGILSDEPGARWGTEEFDHWLTGKRQTPMQRKSAAKSDTPFHFCDRDFRNPRSLAHAFWLHPSEAVEAIKGEDLGTWLMRSLGDGHLAEDITAIAEAAKVQEGSYRAAEAYIVAKACIRLDPAGPIRYKDIAFFPESIGPVLAVELLRKGNMQTPTEIINYGIAEMWFAASSLTVRDHSSFAYEGAFGKMRTFLQVKGPGFGIERCLYELNLGLACQSPLIAEQYVLRIEDLLVSLDEIADRVEQKTRPLDRHIAAFIASRFKENIDPHLKALAEPKEASFLIGMLSLMAYVQWKQRVDSLFALTSWIGGLLGPAINTYYSRSTRREIEQEMPRVVRQGNLPALFDLIDNAEKRRKDNDGYGEARIEFTMAETSIQEIETGELSTPEAILTMGQKVAAMSSIVLSMIVVTILFLVESI